MTRKTETTRGRARIPMLVMLGLACASLVLLCTLWMYQSWHKARYRYLREDVISAETPVKKTRAYHELFEHAGPDGLWELQNDPDISIALQSRWEPYRLYKESEDKTEAPCPDIDEFIAVFKKLTQVDPPEWWERTVELSMKPIGRGDFPQPEPHSYLPSNFGDTRVPPGTSIETKSDTVVITIGARNLCISHELIMTLGKQVVEHLDALLDEDISFLAVSMNAGFPYQLACFNSSSWRKLWVNKVWATGRTRLLGVGWHRVSLLRDGGKIFVFGAEPHTPYVDAFDIRDGNVIFRFCTYLWPKTGEQFRMK